MSGLISEKSALRQMMNPQRHEVFPVFLFRPGVLVSLAFLFCQAVPQPTTLHRGGPPASRGKKSRGRGGEILLQKVRPFAMDRKRELLPGMVRRFTEKGRRAGLFFEKML